MRKTVGVPIIAFCRKDDNVATINSMLRKVGIPVHCNHVDGLKQLEQALKENSPEMLIVFDEEQRSDLEAITKLLSGLKPIPPMLLARNNVTEASISDAMAQGARDVVSLHHEQRFQGVVRRELQAHRLNVALGGIANSANRYKAELQTLIENATGAVAEVQEGIIVAANSAWLTLLGYESEDDLAALPFMDLCMEADQPMLKGALIACLRNKWDGSAMRVRLIRADRQSVNLKTKFERIIIEGDPAVRIIVASGGKQENTPVKLLEQAVRVDPATGLYHRHYFLERAGDKISTPLSGGIRAAFYIRPDRFSAVHDTIGTLGTEKLLTHLADLIKGFMQPADLYGRFGGTLFAGIVERGNMNDALSWAEQVRLAIADHVFEIDGRSTSIACTIGLCECEKDASLGDLFLEVEHACRQGRAVGGNRVQLTEQTCESLIIRTEDAEWVPRIKSALASQSFKLVHQPITSLNDDIEGTMDTRVQMIDTNGDAIMAGEFMPIAERMKLIVAIDRWVIDASIKFCEEKQPSLVFVRLSADSIADKTLPKWLSTRLTGPNRSASKLCFQIEEDVAARYLKRIMAVVPELRKIGFRIAIDHVTGKHDLEKLAKLLRVDYFKIDGSLMQGLQHNSEIQDTVRNIAELATKYQAKTIAERVEDANTMATLWQIGVSFIQGNYTQMQGVVLEHTETQYNLAVV